MGGAITNTMRRLGGMRYEYNRRKDESKQRLSILRVGHNECPLTEEHVLSQQKGNCRHVREGGDPC
jgi:hypothetical protein